MGDSNGIKVTIDMLSLRPAGIRQAFEIEDIHTRLNFTFEFVPVSDGNPAQVILWDTSRNVGKKKDIVYTEENGRLVPSNVPEEIDAATNPFGCTIAYDYFVKLYEKATKWPPDAPLRYVFLGWVDPDTIEPLAEMFEEEDEDDLEPQEYQMTDEINDLYGDDHPDWSKNDDYF